MLSRFSAFNRLILVVVIFGYAVGVSGQDSKSSQPDTCEVVLSKLNGVFVQFEARKTGRDLIVVIGSAAQGENASFNLARLNQVENYLLSRKLKRQEIVQAVGRERAALGYIRFYVDGEFVEEIIVRKRGNVCMDTGA